MTIKQVVEDAVSKIPHPSVWGEVCDCLAQSLERQGANRTEVMGAVDYFCKLCQQKDYC